MAKRLLTSAVGLVVFFAVLPAPVSIFSAFIFLLILIGGFEISNAITKNTLLKVVGVLSSATVFFGMMSGLVMECIIAVFAVYMILSVFLYSKEKASNIYMLGFMTVIVSAFLSYIAIIKREFSSYEVLLLFVFAWITDTGAYFTGCSIGKHKLCEKLSPKKTVEGAVGGVLACILCSVIYFVILKYLFNYTIFENMGYLKIILLSAVISVMSQIGDLIFSAIKREFGIKDYGNLLPGHGGVLDRFDSTIFLAPFVYYMLILM